MDASPHAGSRGDRARRAMRRVRRPALWGTVRRLTPISDRWGFDRGTPIDRAYIAAFLERHAGDITGDVLEVQEPLYSGRYGAGVLSCAVVDIDAGNPAATIVADLAGDPLPRGAFDCAVVTQTLQYIGDPDAALRNLRQSLRPGGVLLATMPAVSRVSAGAAAVDRWRVTGPGARTLFERAFPPEAVTVASYGNVLSAMGFLTGVAAEELTRRELRANDPSFPVVVGVRAVREPV